MMMKLQIDAALATFLLLLNSQCDSQSPVMQTSLIVLNSSISPSQPSPSTSSIFASQPPINATRDAIMSTDTPVQNSTSSTTHSRAPSIAHPTSSSPMVRQSGSPIISSSSSTNQMPPSPTVAQPIVSSPLSTGPTPPSPTVLWPGLAITLSSSATSLTPSPPTVSQPGSGGDGETPAVFAGIAAAVASILAVGVLVIIAAIVLVRKRRKHKQQPFEVSSVNESYGVVLPNLSTSLKTNSAYGAWGGLTSVGGSVTAGDNSNQAAEYAVVEEIEYIQENDIATHTNEDYEYSYPRVTTGWPTPRGRTPPRN